MIRLCLLIALFAAPLGACCVWDRDSLANEAKGAEALLDVITGRVDRYPARYYEMRLERLQSVARTLASYDDEYIALVRLKRFDALEAVYRAKLAAIADQPGSEARYRLFVNAALGEVLGGISGQTSAIGNARNHMAAAAAERALESGDKYLRRYLDWLAKAELAGDTLLPDFLGLRNANKTGLAENNQLKDRGLADCVEGLISLIQAAPEFENVDVFYALSLALAVNGQQSLAHLARLRACEIIDSGGQSLVPGAPTGQKLKQQITPRKPEGGQMVDMIPLSREMRAAIEADYTRMREAANARNKARAGYLNARLEKGEHPDTHRDFWKDWQDPARVPLTASPMIAPSDGKAPPEPVPPQRDAVHGGIPAPNTPEAGRINIGGLQVHWIGIAAAGVIVAALAVFLGLAATRKRAHDVGA